MGTPQLRRVVLFVVLATLFAALVAVGSAAMQPPTAVSQDASVAKGALPAWRNLTLTGGWVHGGFDSYRAGYYKDAQQVVHLRGSAMNGDPGQSVFRLPRGYRPSHTLWLPVYAFNGSAGGLEILPTGRAWLFDASGSNANVVGYSSFDGISFRVP
jgi:hypothetical protein